MQSRSRLSSDWNACVCECVMTVMWPADIISAAGCERVCCRGVWAARLLYHTPGYRMDSSHRGVGDCVMSV